MAVRASAPLTTQNSGPTGSSTRASSQGSSCSHAQSSMPTSRRRPPLPRRTSSDPRRAVQVGLGERERLADAQAGAPQHDDQPAQPAAVDAVAGVAHDGDDLLDRRWVRGVADPLVARRPAGVEVRQRGG